MGTYVCFFVLCLLYPSLAAAQPLSTDSRWIVDETGHRVKFSCVNWPAHLEAVVAEGLSKRPLDEISGEILEFGFNCVRLTWPLFLFTNDTLANTTVRQSFKNLGLLESLAGFQAANPGIIDLSLIDAYQAVVASLAKTKVMIILDNQISNPGWCCSNFDGNGFFGDKYFNPTLWLTGLTKVATLFRDTPYVVAMSLRNELRGPGQNVSDWYRYMEKGAEVVHAANPNLLVILSGLKFDSDLSFLLTKPVSLTFTNKTVFEVHWYAFSGGQAWESGNPNVVCGQKMSDVANTAGFLMDQGYPLFVSEFGFDMRGISFNDNRFLNCFMGWAAEFDIDWALWTLGGSYYIRQGAAGADEPFGVYNWNWCGIRNQTMLKKIAVLQDPLRGPGYDTARLHKMIFHPMTGLCVKKKSIFGPLFLAPCYKAESWKYNNRQETLTVSGTYYCLQTGDLGEPAKLGILCNDDDSKWEAVSDSKMHLSSKLDNGDTVCLDVDLMNQVITSKCKCMERDTKCDPASQWFKIIDTTRSRAKSIDTTISRASRKYDNLEMVPKCSRGVSISL